MGDGRAEGSSAIGDGGQAAISLMADVDGTGSGSLLDSIPSTLLKKQSSDVWVVALFSGHTSTSYITAVFTLASGHPEFEIKILYCCTLYSTVQ